MDQSKLAAYIERISQEKGYGKCLVTRLNRIIPQFHNLAEFARANDPAVINALALYNRAHSGQGRMLDVPYVGNKLLNLVHDVQAYIINADLEHKAEEKHNIEVQVTRENEKLRQMAEFRKWNPIFKVSALKSVVAMAELCGAEEVDLIKILEIAQAFGFSLNEKVPEPEQKGETK